MKISIFVDYYIGIKAISVSACAYPSAACYRGFIGTVALLSQLRMHLWHGIFPSFAVLFDTTVILYRLTAGSYVSCFLRSV